ncbi:hypothetical protein GCM10012275_54540 [Longimycelium tulufanense]|uniref:Uncharacterized protein n=1 Tax=Longimycelium tulufanense TaxID=907463 RepID=A0A8J3CKI8_9PSEU|nr:hypothetical protein [Longimycelium tulufanense]GGM76958.1 hypothetical protein GCM10012275_54540 [Longimycelium tulufanense]
MPAYVHTRSGERVHTVDNSLEDTRLGLAALEPTSGWRRLDDTPTPSAGVPPRRQEADHPATSASSPTKPRKTRE